VCTAFLAEVVTLYLLGIGNLTEPYYWLFILVTSIPFVLFSFLLVRLVAPPSFKDVLHLSFYPIGAGVFTGAALALVASAVVAALVALGYLPEIRLDRTPRTTSTTTSCGMYRYGQKGARSSSAIVSGNRWIRTILIVGSMGSKKSCVTLTAPRTIGCCEG